MGGLLYLVYKSLSGGGGGADGGFCLIHLC